MFERDPDAVQQPLPGARVADLPGQGAVFLPTDGVLTAEQINAWVAVQLDRCGSRLVVSTPAEHLDAITRWQRLEDLAFVGQLRAVAAAAETVTGTAGGEFFGDEIGLALGASARTGGNLVGLALHATSLPGLLEAVEQGLLTRRHVLSALTVLGGTGPDELGLEVQAAVLMVALGRYHGQTPGQLAALLRRLLRLADRDLARRREHQATAERRIVFSEDRDGQASLWAVGPVAHLAAIRASLEAALTAADRDADRDADRTGAVLPEQEVFVDLDTGEVLTEPAREDQPDLRDERTREARRFDLFTSLLTGGMQAPEHWVVNVLIPYSTTAGGDLELAHVPGLGPVLPQTARDLAALAGATRRIAVGGPDTNNDDNHDGNHDGPKGTAGRIIAVDDLTGPLLPVPGTGLDRALADAARALADKPVRPRDVNSDRGSPGYTPPGRMVRLLEHRDRTCTFPGCTVPAAQTDKDHRIPWPLGPTSTGNLQCLCRRHHRAKQSLWDTEAQPDGSTLWTSRLTNYTYRRPAQGY